MGGGGSDVTTNSYDPVFNARMAELSEEQQDWAKELKNYYEYGVTYDPNEVARGYYNENNKFIRLEDAVKEENRDWLDRYKALVEAGYTDEQARSKRMNPYERYIVVQEAEEPPVGFTEVEQRLGDPGVMSAEGYNENTMSYMKMESAQIAANYGLIDSQTAQAKAEAELGTEKATTEKGLLDDYQKQQEAGYSYDTAKYGADESLLPSYQRSTEAQYGASEAMANAEKALVNPWQNMMESQYGYQTGKYGVDTALLSPYYDATKAGYELSTGQSEAAMSLLPQETRLKSALMTEQETNTALRAPVAEKYYGEVLGGVDVNKRVNEAKADVGEAFKGAEQRTNMALSQYGINPNSGRARSAFSQTGMNYGRSVAGAATGARDKAEDDNFARLSGAMALTPTTA